MIGVIDRIQRKLRESRFARASAGVLDTPPARPKDDGVVIFSMIGTKVLLPYLVAAKSFQSWLGMGRFVILDDGSLTDADRTVLRHHLGNPVIYAIADVETGPCPRGGTWERLLTILDLRKDDYVIQLDSDTVTLGPVEEVQSAIEAGRSFTLAGGSDSLFLPVEQVGHLARSANVGGSHVQSAIEQAMDKVQIPGRADLKYVRGCSGFAGFAPGSDGRKLAEQFSVSAEQLLGRKRWEEWGTEQVTSNFVIANDPQSRLLSYAHYLNFWNEPVDAKASFVHFVGTYRYHRGAYEEAARQAIAKLAA